MIGPADLEAWREDAEATRRSESGPREERPARRAPLPLSLATPWSAMLGWRRRLRGRPD